MAPWRYPNSVSHITNEITPYWLNPESLDYYMEDKHQLSMYRSQIYIAEIDPWKDAKDRSQSF